MNKTTTTEYSKSKQKRIAIQEAANKRQRQQTVNKVIIGVIIAAVVCLVLGIAYSANLFNIKTIITNPVEPETDYSAGLADDGTIEGINTADYIGTFDVSSITLDEDDVTYSDDSMDSHIQSLVESYKTLNDSADLTAASGDTLSINYVGTVDGEEFDGGSADDQDLELGSGTFIDGFEDQLIGAHPGDDVTVNVTFPDDYGVDDLNGKDAVFAVHVNGIYEIPAFDDAFVQTNLADSGYTTAEEYKEGYRAEQVQSLYNSAIDSWVGENVTPDSYPKTYLRHIEGLLMTDDATSYEYYKSLYETYGLSFDYDSYQDLYATDDQTYEENRDERAKTTVTKTLVYQNVFENAGLTITDEEYQTYLDDNSVSDTDLETYGKGYYMQRIIREKALDYMQDLVTVTSVVEDSTETTDTAATETTAE